MKKKIGILIVNYNGLRWLSDCLTSVLTTEQTGIEREVYLVDNNSTDTSVAFVREQFPEVHIIQLAENTGFAGGNNAGWKYIQQYSPCDYIMLLNEDARLTDGCLPLLADYLDRHDTCAAVQPKLKLWPDTNRLNSLGNVIHYLGFGYTSANDLVDTNQLSRPQIINSCSGAAVMIRPEAVPLVGGLFADFMFMYLEDLDFGWRTMLAGWDSVIVPEAVVYHQYEFHRSLKQYYYFERNRLWIIGQNYRWGTLLMLLPAIIFMELGQLFFAWRNHTLVAKLRSYAWLLQWQHLSQLMHEHARVARLRQRSDRQILSAFSGKILFQPLEGPLLRYIANPIFNAYLSLIRLLIIW
jgi:GT2 family glycosyltransferase